MSKEINKRSFDNPSEFPVTFCQIRFSGQNTSKIRYFSSSHRPSSKNNSSSSSSLLKGGSSAKEDSPKYCKKSGVLPYRIGRPGVSIRPISSIKSASYSISFVALKLGTSTLIISPLFSTPKARDLKIPSFFLGD